MKKMFAIVLALMLCVTALSVVAFAEGETVTVHAQVPIDWDAPNVYTWVKDSTGPAWPGTAMTLDGDWWVGEVPATDNMVIINNSDGTSGPQTGDTEIEGGKDVWVVVADDLSVTVSYEAPAAGDDTTTEGGDDTTTEGGDNTASPETGDMGIAAVSAALLAATAGLVATVSKKKEN